MYIINQLIERDNEEWGMQNPIASGKVWLAHGVTVLSSL